MNARWVISAALSAAVWMGCSSDTDPDGPGSGGDGGNDEVDGGGPNPGGDGGPVPGGDGGIPDDPFARCGDGNRTPSEACDDGNMDPGDGCDASCKLEAGYECKVPGMRCARTVVCGDGQIGPGEVCDDMNTMAGDGCAVDCRQIETNFVCPTPGMSCISTMICGDGRVVGSEQCDDKNTTPGDGCSADCQTVEEGWSCRFAGVRCLAAECGDGKRVGSEACDDGGRGNGDGCDENCQVELGWICPVGESCRQTVCGNNLKEGTEQCDDGNDRPFDLCYKCQGEPNCGNEGCAAVCGDGIVFPGEGCDDGNTVANDGCSATCAFEEGYQCMTLVEDPPATLSIPIIYRDFRGLGLPVLNGQAGHPDFENNPTVSETGIVGPTLGPDKKPVYAKEPTQGLGSATTHGAAAFNQWYNDTPNVNITVPDALTLNRQVDGSYRFDSTAFFPLNTRGWRGTLPPGEPLRPAKNDANMNIGDQSFHFTSELRYWFEFGGGERLDFRGDDDVWVFVNGRRVIDIGGVHGALDASVTLMENQNGMVKGQIYEIVLFQAERHTTQSSYKLTLRGFEKKKTRCASVCGDGILTPDEICDDGKDPATMQSLNTGAYGRCNADCQGFGPRCGDGMLQGEHEQCDNGINLGSYGMNGCTAECKFGPRCGDGKVDGVFGEQCDDGSNDGGYGECFPSCMLGERCGDGVKQPQEECDDGNTNAGDSCDNGCKNTAAVI